MVPPFGAPLGATAPDSALLSSLLEPHAATPSASTHRAASEATNRGDVNTLSLFDCICRAVAPAAGSRSPHGVDEAPPRERLLPLRPQVVHVHVEGSCSRGGAG